MTDLIAGCLAFGLLLASAAGYLGDTMQMIGLYGVGGLVALLLLVALAS